MNLNDPALAHRLHDLIVAHNIGAFIETGTGYGVSLRWAYEAGLDCWTCDVEERQIAPAQSNFPTAHVYHAESVPFLEIACGNVKVPALFWLDAHDAHPADGIGPLWPAGEEIETIALLRNGKDVILMDDITDPRFDVEAYTKPFAATHRVTITHGILWLTPR